MAAGTAWLWARQELRGASTCCSWTRPARCRSPTCSPSRRRPTSIVLLGDPQQLEQPQKGSHPDGIDVTALEHLLGAHQTIPRDRGLFLRRRGGCTRRSARSRRSCSTRGGSTSKPGLERQTIVGADGLRRRGLVVVAGRARREPNASAEEVEVVGGLGREPARARRAVDG